MSVIEDANLSFGENVFSDRIMKEMLSKESYEEVQKAIAGTGELSLKAADEVANAMKTWATEHKATHYCHWFQPLTGFTAEKHDAFVHRAKDEGLRQGAMSGRAINKFSGKELIKGEPDASAFPSGGLRATFEARGYTAWDCTSPAFVREDALGVTLYIPTAFCSYNGEALDKKTPLIRSVRAVSKEAIRLLRVFGNTTSEMVIPCVGAEQEYFIVDRNKYLERRDLVFAGRTLFGAQPPKGQEMGDHYMGTIPERLGAYMKDVNDELWKLGVPAKTLHNEAAPAQHELAPIYEEANIATDHNQLIMETLKTVAGRHDLMCLLHEKPFSGVNGSGKHNNWSLSTDDGIRLFDPGKNPHENLQFMVFLACMIQAVDRHGDLLLESAADVGNDERLGENEAPPVIMSMYLGTQLTDLVNQLVLEGHADSSIQGKTILTDVTALPSLAADVTDRNRTSPFAFTGNKFEFRSVGSKDSIAEPNVVLNTIAAESFREAAEFLENAEDLTSAVYAFLNRTLSAHEKVIFNGNNYSKDWPEEAEKRGLYRSTGMVDAIGILYDEKTKELFEKFGVYSERELLSRAEIKYDTYAKAMNIEARTMIDQASTQIIPVVIREIAKNAECVNQVRMAAPTASVNVQVKLVGRMSYYLDEAQEALEKLEKELKEACEESQGRKRAEVFCKRVVPAMKALRAPIDALETMVDRKAWPMPTYADLMYEV